MIKIGDRFCPQFAASIFKLNCEFDSFKQDTVTVSLTGIDASHGPCLTAGPCCGPEKLWAGQGAGLPLTLTVTVDHGFGCAGPGH